MCAILSSPDFFLTRALDMLVRYRLHACAAYLRKYALVEEVQKTTRVCILKPRP